MKTKPRTWLKEIREGKGLSMKTVARDSDIAECYYCQIENGTRNASVKVAKRIAEALGFSWQKFFEDEN